MWKLLASVFILHHHQILTANSVVEEPDYYIIGFFSICSNSIHDISLSNDANISVNQSSGVTITASQSMNKKENFNQSMAEKEHLIRPNGKNSSPLDIYKAYTDFERLAAYYNLIYIQPYNKTVKALSIDVCNQETLVNNFLTLLLDKNFMGKMYPIQRYSKEPQYVAVFSYMNDHLTNLAIKLFQVDKNKVPFVIMRRMRQTEWDPTTTQYYDFKGRGNVFRTTVLQIPSLIDRAYRTKSASVDNFEWRSIVTLTLTQTKNFIRATNYFYEALSTDPRYCIYKMEVFTAGKLSRALKLLIERNDLAVIYAIGSKEDTLKFFKRLDQMKIYNRVLFLDYTTQSYQVPSALAKGLFYFSNFNMWKDTVFVPDTFNHNLCLATKSVTLALEPGSCNTTIQNNGSINAIDINIKYAVFTAFDFLNIMNDGEMELPSSYLVSFLRLRYNFDIKELVIKNTRDNLEEKEFYWISMLDVERRELAWPGNLTGPPIISCENQAEIPPGFYQTFGSVPHNQRKWDQEVRWFLKKCSNGFYKSSYGDSPCLQCPLYTKSNAERTGCYDPYLNLQAVNFHTNEGILLLIALVVGTLTSFVCLGCYGYLRNTPIAKSSQLGFTLTHLATHSFLFVCFWIGFSSSSEVSCWIPTLFTGSPLVLIFCISLIKTQIVVWIFRSNNHFSKGDKRKQTTLLIAATTAILSVSILITIISSMQQIPQIEIIYDHEKLIKFHYCNFGDQLHAQIIYTMFLSILSAVQGVRARRLPEAFKSTRYIIYAMYSNVVLNVVFLTLYNIHHNNKYRQVYVLAFTLFLSNILILLIVYTQRVLDLLNHKKNNVTFIRQQISSNMSKTKDSIEVKVLPQK